ncbi:hypothetical protein [Vagococcus zengguangii]|uniref:Uncharacterized protein n=1 Tax=Vagococcus zengguangii TaxID=2571750 RepID=A0A4D7CS21_9ENTE|nr:hypothetical protein [Vagococcus zengguangii]QCI85664.1 hypothetical protein FA707_01175 [Vagococcus zengguangii]TLG81604.1 hypothetical protein FE258_00155 [Vagococcus zengguangii]
MTEKTPKLKYQRNYVKKMVATYMTDAEDFALLSQKADAEAIHKLVKKKTSSARIVEAMDLYFKKGELNLLKYYDNAFASIKGYEATTPDVFGLNEWHSPEVKAMFEAKVTDHAQTMEVKKVFASLDVSDIAKITKSEKYTNYITMAWLVGLKTTMETLEEKFSK